MHAQNKPFAPFGAIFCQLLQAGIQLRYSVFFFVGKDAEKEAKTIIENGQLALCLPSGHQLDHYRWHLDGAAFILYDTGGMTSLGLSKLAHGILTLGAKSVLIYSEDNSRLEVYGNQKDKFHDEIEIPAKKFKGSSGKRNQATRRYF